MRGTTAACAIDWKTGGTGEKIAATGARTFAIVAKTGGIAGTKSFGSFGSFGTFGSFGSF